MTGDVARGVVAVVPRAGCLLVVRRSQRVVAPGAYCFPGGWIETGEDERAAVARELREELSAEVQPRHRLWRSVTPWNVALAWWLCDLVSVELRPDVAEVQSVHWLAPPDLRRLPELLASNRHFLDAWQQGAFDIPQLDRPA